MISKSDSSNIFYNKTLNIKKYNQMIKNFFTKNAEITEMTYKINILHKCLDISI